VRRGALLYDIQSARLSVTETARLRLRRLSSADAAFILELLTDPDFLVNIGDRGVHSLGDAQRYITDGPALSYERFGFGLYLVELKETCAALGLCGLLRRDSHPDVEIGFAFVPRARRCGYALEAAAATLQLGVHALGLTRIVALTGPDNAASIGILEHLGLRFERMVHFTPDGRESRLFVYQRAVAP
jgi:[ribosomal protein S5]-alanine N-acetyltransferase